MRALMKRFGGHPYERGDALDFRAVDPDKSIHDNLLALGYHNNELVRGHGFVCFPFALSCLWCC